jgi:hypothetical protein
MLKNIGARGSRQGEIKFLAPKIYLLANTHTQTQNSILHITLHQNVNSPAQGYSRSLRSQTIGSKQRAYPCVEKGRTLSPESPTWPRNARIRRSSVRWFNACQLEQEYLVRHYRYAYSALCISKTVHVSDLLNGTRYVLDLATVKQPHHKLTHEVATARAFHRSLHYFCLGYPLKSLFDGVMRHHPRENSSRIAVLFS